MVAIFALNKISILGANKLIVFVFCTFIIESTLSQVVNTPKTPLMGWSSWNNFSVNISESIIVGQSDAMISTGLSTVGYKYINIDDGYFGGRYSDGTLKIDSNKFPNGMKIVVDYIHSKGLKAGVYSDAGTNTCGSIWNQQAGGIGAGLYNHDQQDIDLFFNTWGFDYLKVDYCGGLQQTLDEKTRYSAIKTLINNTGIADINYNVCRWPFMGSWITNIADSWRIAFDIDVSWASIIRIIDLNTFLAPYVSQGHYNDMDMLEVGRGLSPEEDKSHFSMWCLLSSPLVLGNDLKTMTQKTKDILTNTEVIAVDQDTTGLQGHLVSDNRAGLQVWAKNLNGKQSNERAVVLFNRSAAAASISVKWKELNLMGPANVRDLWSHTDLGSMDSSYTAIVPSHGVVMLKIIWGKTILQEVFEAEYAWINNFNLIQNSEIVADQGRVVIDTLCSGRAKVEWLGNRADNYIEFRDIYADSTKSYHLTISYISGENRNATLSVNGIDTVLTNLNSGGWSTIKRNNFNVKLNKGFNTIRFSNVTGWLPDIDKIQIDFNKDLTSSIGNHYFSNLSINVYPNPCTSFLQIDSESPIKQVDIYSLTGCLLKKCYQSHISVYDLYPGAYLLKVTSEKNMVIQLIIKE
jgi:Alpha galactosidase A/Alpha galactosidase C-terminal beta sandwich domain/Secretion system C-terminal sorting domain